MPSIMQSLYNSVSGMFGFSQTLDTISNNISNMNTPGFRGSESFLENVMGGDGTKVAGTGQNLSEGQIEQTNTSSDVAINGEGLFILKDSEGHTYYTRSGQFEFNSSGTLIDSVNKYAVQGYDASGGFGDMSIADLKTLPAQASSTINITGNIVPTDPSGKVSNITVYDAQGNAHVLTLTLTNNSKATAGSWTVAVTDSTDATIGTGEVRFSSTAYTPAAGYNTVTITPTLGGQPQKLTFNFGTAGGLSGATQMPGVADSLAAQVADGHGVIGISSYAFDQNGVLQLTYADAEVKAGPQLALASFPDESSLQEIQGNLYTPPMNQSAQVGRASTGILGGIEGGSLEMSNVDLTQELAEMIVIQRGYQASSRVMTVSGDMLQQLYDSTRGS